MHVYALFTNNHQKASHPEDTDIRDFIGLIEVPRSLVRDERNAWYAARYDKQSTLGSACPAGEEHT